VASALPPGGPNRRLQSPAPGTGSAPSGIASVDCLPGSSRRNHAHQDPGRRGMGLSGLNIPFPVLAGKAGLFHPDRASNQAPSRGTQDPACPGPDQVGAPSSPRSMGRTRPGPAGPLLRFLAPRFHMGRGICGSYARARTAGTGAMVAKPGRQFERHHALSPKLARLVKHLIAEARGLPLLQGPGGERAGHRPGWLNWEQPRGGGAPNAARVR
jgi:hypothetical protein